MSNRALQEISGYLVARKYPSWFKPPEYRRLQSWPLMLVISSGKFYIEHIERWKMFTEMWKVFLICLLSATYLSGAMDHPRTIKIGINPHQNVPLNLVLNAKFFQWVFSVKTNTIWQQRSTKPSLSTTKNKVNYFCRESTSTTRTKICSNVLISVSFSFIGLPVGHTVSLPTCIYGTETRSFMCFLSKAFLSVGFRNSWKAYGNLSLDNQKSVFLSWPYEMNLTFSPSLPSTYRSIGRSVCLSNWLSLYC